MGASLAESFLLRALLVEDPASLVFGLLSRSPFGTLHSASFHLHLLRALLL
jgi:hypothetical protein